MAGWLQSINYVIMVVFGGMGSLTGSIVSAIALTILPELLRAFSTYRMLVYSVALVLIMIFRPQHLRQLGILPDQDHQQAVLPDEGQGARQVEAG